jgi:hypothetical protein
MRLHAEEVVVKITVALSLPADRRPVLPAEVLPQLIAVLEGAPTPELRALANRARAEFAAVQELQLRIDLERWAA